HRAAGASTAASGITPSIDTVPMMTETTLGWARPWALARPFTRPTPRAGAWYPIVGEAGDERVVLEIRGRRVAVQKKLLEIRAGRPDRITVVSRGVHEESPAA